MDTSSGNYRPNLIGAALTGVKPSLDNLCMPPAGSIPSLGLTRYHSAPTSILASLLEPDVYTPSHGLDLVHHYLAHGDLAEFTSVGLSLKPNDKEQPSSTSCQGHNLEGYSIRNDMVGRQLSSYMVENTGRSHFPEHIGPGPLSAILEHGEDTLLSRPLRQSPREREPLLTPPCLIRHSSLPADFISRLLTDDVSEGSFTQHVSEEPFTQHMSAHVQTPPRLLRADNNTGGKVFVLTSSVSPRPVPIRKSYVEANSNGDGDVCNMSGDELKYSGLLRQSSSPTGMLSQLSLDRAASGSEKVTLLSPMGRSSAQRSVHVMGVEWDEDAMDAAMQKIEALGQRKRGRNGEARLYEGVPTTQMPLGSMDSCAPSNLYAVMGAGNTEGLLADSVLCKSRAKRGCATHPRSIAERVRRTKISDRIKKLQDLVPNLDKQAHMADMLDEVVQYVKLLQNQVQELSRHAPVCNRVNRMCLESGGP